MKVSPTRRWSRRAVACVLVAFAAIMSAATVSSSTAHAALDPSVEANLDSITQALYQTSPVEPTTPVPCDAICEDLSAQLEQDASDGSGFARASVPGEQALARGWNALLQETKLLPKAAVWGPFLYFGAFANGWLIGNGIHRKWIHMRTDLEDTIDLSNASLAYASKGDTNPFTSFSAPVAMPFDGWYVDVGTAARLGNWSQTESRCSRPGPINFAVPGFKQLDWRWNSCWEGYDPLMNDIITPMYTSALVAPEMAITDSLPEPYDGQSGTYRYQPAPADPGFEAARERLRQLLEEYREDAENGDDDATDETTNPAPPWIYNNFAGPRCWRDPLTTAVRVEIPARLTDESEEDYLGCLQTLGAVDDTTDAIADANPELLASDSQRRQKIKVAVRECFRRTSNASASRTASRDDCESLPIFVTGRDAAAATDHDLTALAGRPSWVKLTYRIAGQKEPWYYAFPETRPGGATSCKGVFIPGDLANSTACDEFPFWTNVEGGPHPAPDTPHLEIIDWLDNSLQGSRLNSFYTTCKLEQRLSAPSQYGSGHFLILPMPDGSAVDSMSICNGNPPN